jgi:hypothetical protein
MANRVGQLASTIPLGLTAASYDLPARPESRKMAELKSVAHFSRV